MRFRTVIYLTYGATYLFLLFGALIFTYFSHSSIKDLETVAIDHLPSLQLLSESYNHFQDAKKVYQEFSETSYISKDELLVYIDRLRLLSKTIYKNENNILIDNLGNLLIVKNPGDEIDRRRKAIFFQLDLLLHKWTNDQLPVQMNDENAQLVILYSKLLRITETAVDLFFSQNNNILAQIVKPLNICIEKLNDLNKTHFVPSIHFLEEKEKVEDLLRSIARYKAAIVLMNDEKALGVSGANLSEINNAVNENQLDATLDFRVLNHSLLNKIQFIQNRLIISNQRIQKGLVVGLALGSVLFFLILLVVRKVLAKRVKILVDGAEKFSQGDLDFRFKINPTDKEDLGRLTIAFNQMADKLQQREREKADFLEKLNKSQKMEAIGMMAGGVAHDLNNILSGIVSYPDLLLLELPQESNLRQPLETIRQSGYRAADIVADLLTVARGIANVKESKDIHEIISEYIGSPEHKKLLTRYPQVKLKISLESQSTNISCSPSHVKKSIMNIIYNAFESMSGEGTCSLSTQNIHLGEEDTIRLNLDRKEYSTLTIQDTGRGISDEDIEHIFEPFYTRNKMGRSGTGLGLAIVYNTMKDHHGTVTVVSSPKGTTFTLYFPVDPHAPRKTREEKVISIEKLSKDGERILVVDDESQLCEIAHRMLSKLKYEVYSVRSGEEALKFLKTNQVDLVLLDMLMEPGINGLETYKRIIQLYPGQKAIIASGYSEGEFINKAFELGVGGFLKKPYSTKQLGEAIKKELSR